MAEYIDRNQLIQRIKQEPTDGMYTEEILSAIDEIEAADVAEVRHGKWELTVERGSCYDYHVTAHCSECGWEWIGKDSECVGNNKYVFSAFIKGKKELAEQFALDNAKQRSLYNFCPNCGSKMGDEEA